MDENCYKCGGVLDLEQTDWKFDMAHLDYVHKRCDHKTGCSYCGEWVDQTRLTPYMVDALHGYEMCRGCWEMTRTTHLKSEETDIGDF